MPDRIPRRISLSISPPVLNISRLMPGTDTSTRKRFMRFVHRCQNTAPLPNASRYFKSVSSTASFTRRMSVEAAPASLRNTSAAAAAAAMFSFVNCNCSIILPAALQKRPCTKQQAPVCPDHPPPCTPVSNPRCPYAPVQTPTGGRICQ